VLMIIRVVEAGGKELAMERDLGALRAKLGEAAQLSFAAAKPEFERTGIKTWDFGELPETITVVRDGQKVIGYPALIDGDDSVALKLLDTRTAADAATRTAVLRLLRGQLKEALRRWEKNPPGFATAALLLKPLIATDVLLADVMAAVADRALLGDDPLPRSEGAFAEQVKRARTRLPAVAEGAFRLLGAIANEHHILSQRLASLPRAMSRIAQEVRAQRDNLV